MRKIPMSEGQAEMQTSSDEMREASSQRGVSSVQSMPVSTIDDEPQDDSLRASGSWRPICNGVVDSVLMQKDGSHVIISTESSSFAAFIHNAPVIELGMKVQLGVRRVVKGNDETDEADIIAI